MLHLPQYRPNIAVPFDHVPERGALEALKTEGMDVVEWRLDLMEDPESAIDALASFTDIPSIGTIRMSNEGGEWRENSADRLPLFEKMLPHVNALDVELQSGPFVLDVKRLCQSQEKSLIISSHHFRGLPEMDDLCEEVERASELEADYIKIAVMLEDDADLAELAGLLTTFPALPLIVIGMGDVGNVSRVCFPFLGSRLSFAQGDVSTAPGQLPLKAMMLLYRALGKR